MRLVLFTLFGILMVCITVLVVTFILINLLHIQKILINSMKILSPNRVPLTIRYSTYEFWGNTVQSIISVKIPCVILQLSLSLPCQPCDPDSSYKMEVSWILSQHWERCCIEQPLGPWKTLSKEQYVLSQRYGFWFIIVAQPLLNNTGGIWLLACIYSLFLSVSWRAQGPLNLRNLIYIFVYRSGHRETRHTFWIYSMITR